MHATINIQNMKSHTISRNTQEHKARNVHERHNIYLYSNIYEFSNHEI